jgi:cytochrome c-type biogenesis protein CcmH/NrfG
MVSPRIREVSDNKEMARLVDDFMTQGYTTTEQGAALTLMKKKPWGSAAGWIVVFVVVILLSIPQPTIVWLVWVLLPAYVLYAHYTAHGVLIRVAQT